MPPASSRLALLISQSMIVPASIEILDCQGLDGDHLPTNSAVSVPMKIESGLVQPAWSGPRCNPLWPGPSLRQGIICWACLYL
jgi:hypothetical protein